MKKSRKILGIVLGIAAAVFLIGSFPVKHCYGQMPCDIVRMIGFVLLLSYCGVTAFGKKDKNENP